MNIVIAISIFIIISINIIAYLICKNTVTKHQVFKVDNETEEKIKKWKFYTNIFLKIRTTPSLIFLIILQTILLYTFLSQDYLTAKIIQNPKLVHASITRKFTKKYEERIYYHVDYEFEINNKKLSPILYIGTGKIDEKNFNDIDSKTLLKVTYNANNPQESQIGDITKLTLGNMITRRIIAYSFIVGLYILTLFGAYYIIFKIKTKFPKPGVN